VNAVDRDIDALHSFMLVRHGAVVAEGWWSPYRAADPHVLFSLSKSFTSTAIGLLVTEGRLSVDDAVLSFFPDEAPAAPGDNLRAMRVRHLLSMSTGHTAEPFSRMEQYPGKTWVEMFLMHPVEHAPGTYFLYNSHATYMLSAIAQKITGERLVDYLKPRLFDPLDIRNPTWEMSPQGIDIGGWGLSVTTADIAAFGQLYLQKGVWRETRILPESWIDAATSTQIGNDGNANVDWRQGYGYQFWRCRHNTYRGDGAFGQYCLVMPDQDAVLAMTGGLGDMQPTLDLVWEHLLPAMRVASLAADERALAALNHTLANLQLRTVQGAALQPIAAQVSGRSLKLADNPDGIAALQFEFDADKAVISVYRAQGKQQIACGHGVWLRSEAVFPPLDHSMREGPTQGLVPWKIAASGAWTDEHTYTAKVWWYETPFACVLTCRFQEDRVTVEQRGNVSFDSTEGPTLSSA
jgi:CubicO group peptidase (beta-lactamase class C family)